MIKPEFFDDPDVADVSLAARLCFIGLWTQADRDGRLEDDVRRLKVRLFPFDSVDVDALAGELANKEMIFRYLGTDGKRYIWIPNFTKHQRPHPKEPASVIPLAVERNGETRINAAEPSDSGFLSLDSETRILDERARASLAPAFLEFPIIGPGASAWQLSEAQVAEWATLFPNLDVRAQSRQALAWIQASPGRRKTGKGMARFLVGWFGRAVDSGRVMNQRQAPPAFKPDTWECPHVEQHTGRNACHVATQLGRPTRAVAS